MARADYYGIELEINDVLLADPDLAGVNVLVEAAVNTFEGPTVIVFLDERQAPDDGQTLSGGTRTVFRLIFTLVCVGVNYESLAAAARARDELIGRVEVALMRNRTLNGRTRGLWLEGGFFDNARNEESGQFVSAGEVRAVMEVTSSTV